MTQSSTPIKLFLPGDDTKKEKRNSNMGMTLSLKDSNYVLDNVFGLTVPTSLHEIYNYDDNNYSLVCQTILGSRCESEIKGIRVLSLEEKEAF